MGSDRLEEILMEAHAVGMRDEVMKRANNNDLGLASYIYTNNLEKAHKASELIETGTVAVNTPVELKEAFSAAASLAAVLKLNFVALLLELKSPSDTASIPAATNIASVP